MGGGGGLQEGDSFHYLGILQQIHCWPGSEVLQSKPHVELLILAAIICGRIQIAICCMLAASVVFRLQVLQLVQV